jgi:hypothetical protein
MILFSLFALSVPIVLLASVTDQRTAVGHDRWADLQTSPVAHLGAT